MLLLLLTNPNKNQNKSEQTENVVQNQFGSVNWRIRTGRGSDIVTVTLQRLVSDAIYSYNYCLPHKKVLHPPKVGNGEQIIAWKYRNL